MAILLREQEAPGGRDHVFQARETSSRSHSRIQKIEAILSRTPDRGLNQLPTTSIATKFESLKQALQVSNRVRAI